MLATQIAARIRQSDPSISEEEAMAMAQEEVAGESRTDGAPSTPLDVDPGPGDGSPKYQYNPVSRTWDPIRSPAQVQQQEQDDARRTGRFGYRWGGEEAFGSADEAEGYRTRPDRGPSQRDLDMLRTNEVNPSGTGWVEVYLPDGRTTLMRRAPMPDNLRPGMPGYRAPGDAPGQAMAAQLGYRDMTVDGGMPSYMQGYDWGGPEPGWANEVTGNQRTGAPVMNRDVQSQMPASIGDIQRGASGEMEVAPNINQRVPSLRQGPNGPVWVYDYKPENLTKVRDRAAAQKDELQLRRMASRAGVPLADARGMVAGDGGRAGGIQQLRDLALDRQNQDREARREAVRRLNMLAGNNPRANLTNAFGMLDDEQQQQAVLGAMFPRGATPLDVVQAQAMAEARLNANQALADPFAQQLRAQQLRQADPAAAGANDIAEGKYETPEAQAEFERLAAQFDNNLIGMGYDQRDAMAAALQRPPYDMDPNEAEAYAYRYTAPRMNDPGGPPGSPNYFPPGASRPNAPPANPPPARPLLPPGGQWRPPAGMPGV